MVKDGVLMTPRLESGCLPGVTRALVIQRAKKADLVVRETAVQLEDLLEADEVFLTNTQIGVQAVDRIGELEFAAGFCPGDVTQKVKEIYLAK
jgi:branched-chain amino acid aminotransferase